MVSAGRPPGAVDRDGDRKLDFPDGDDVPLEVDGQALREPFTATRG